MDRRWHNRFGVNRMEFGGFTNTSIRLTPNRYKNGKKVNDLIRGSNVNINPINISSILNEIQNFNNKYPTLSLDSKSFEEFLRNAILEKLKTL